MLELQRDPVPVRVSVAMCGGIPTYLAAWDELNHRLFILERTPKGLDKWKDLYYEAIKDGQRLIDLFFVAQPGEKVTVVGVTREYHDKRDFGRDVSDAESD